MNRLKRLDKLVSGDPVLQKLKESYDNSMIQEFNKTEATKYAKKTISISDRANIERKVYSDKQQEIIQRSSNNIRFGKSLSKDEKEKKFLEDLILSGGMSLTTDNSTTDNTIPSEYVLHQNYPNPFNPVTKIKYQCQKTDLFKLRYMMLLVVKL